MTNPPALLRSLIISAICLPLAIVLGYTLAGPFSYGFVGIVGTCFFVLLLPVLLKIHHPLLLLGWNATMTVFFLPGQPGVWLPLAAFSILVSIIHRSIDQDQRFISVRSLIWPLLVLTVVILVTAEARGGIKIRSLGGEFYGGKHYLLLLFAILGYFALTANAIPRERAHLYTALFLLGGMTTLIGDMFYFQNPVLQYIYWFFPANTEAAAGLRSGITRFFGVNQAALLTAYYMMAKYGIRGIFSAKTPWRVLIFAVLVAASTLGGFRSFFIAFLLAFSIQFFLEGLHRTKLLPIMILGVLLIGAVTIPFVRQMPYSVQRALSFLPLPVDPLVRADADTSSTWRVELWKSILPQVPEYFWFGKGYVFSKRDFDYAINQYLGYEHAISEDESWAALAGDYHNGPLSVIIPFGIWGAAAFLWFLWAGVRVLYRNFRYGDPDLRIINAFLLAGFITRILVFMIIFGGFDGDMHFFVGYLGFSICLNHGMCRRPAPEPPGQRSIQDTVPVRSRMEPAFQRSRYRE